MLGVGDDNAKIMVVQDYPDEIDDKKGFPFAAKTSIKLRKFLEQNDIDTDNIYWTSLIKCSVGDNAKAAKVKHAKICGELFLEQEIEEIDPDIIVTTGKLSNSWFKITDAPTKVRGNAIESEICGRNRIILPTLHPRMTLAKPLYRDYIKSDILKLKELVTDGLKEVEGVDYHYPKTMAECLIEIDKLNREAKELSFDLETTGKSPYKEWSKIVCISLSMEERTGVMIPLYHHETPLWGYELGTVVKKLRELLENPKIPKIAQNGKFDMEWLDVWLDIKVANYAGDSQFGHYLTISEELGTQGLKSQAWEFTDMGGYDNKLDEYKKSLPDSDGPEGRNNYDNIPWNILSEYGCADADCTLRCWHIYKQKLDQNYQWTTIMNDILIPASYAIMEMEENGMKMDMEVARHHQETYAAEVKRITDRLESYPEVLELEREKQQLWVERQAIGAIPKSQRTPEEQEKFEKYKKYQDYKFNFGSVQQLSELLYDRLGLVTSIKTDTGANSTNEEALMEIREQHDIPDLLLELRKVTTLNNMFISKLPLLVDKNNIIHPSFNITGTVTGRMSSENPNQQQLPRPSENPLSFQYQNEIKSLFCSRYGDNGCILNADYSALEMRIAGIISGDPTLLKAFQSGKDLHKSTASLVWGVPIDEVSKEMRTNAKSVNFGIIYGKSGVTFAQDLFYDPSGKNPKKTKDWEKAKKEGMKLVDDYLKTFSGLRDWINNTKKSAYKKGYVKTMFGRYRRLPDLKSKVNKLKTEAERQAINAPVQGTGSDLTLLSIVSIQRQLKDGKYKSKMICTVHDSIVFDIYIPELAEVAKMIKNTMEHIHEPYIDTEVPIVSEIEMGRSYGEMFEVELDEIDELSTPSEFHAWVNKNSLKKYQKEIDTMISSGYTSDMIVDYMIDNNRPIEKLEDYIIDKLDERGD